MSRHILPAKDANFTVVIGWDNPLHTFFTQVVRGNMFDDDESDPVILWIGGDFGEVSDPSELAAPLAPYADLTQEHLAQLRADRAAHSGRRPTPAQLANLTALGKIPRPGDD
jgi:hypothetical protein